MPLQVALARGLESDPHRPARSDRHKDWRLHKPSKQPLAFDERVVPEIAAIKPKQIESIVVLWDPAAHQFVDHPPAIGR